MAQEKDAYGKLVKALQIGAFVLMIAAAAVCVYFMQKYDIKPKNAGDLTKYLAGGTVTAALILVGFSIVKSFALVFPPAVLFVLSGLVFRNFWLAVLVNAVATAFSLILPYYLGRFTGQNMVRSLSGRFKAIKKLDDFADANSFSLVFIFKAGGLLPSDLSSLIFGAMGIGFKQYFPAANLGMLILNVLWSLVGVKGDLSNPLSFLYALPALLFAIAAAVYMSVRNKKRALKASGTDTGEGETR